MSDSPLSSGEPLDSAVKRVKSAVTLVRKLKCFNCGKKIFYTGRGKPPTFCGNSRKKTGCAHQRSIIIHKLWKHENEYWKRPHIKAKNRVYGKKYDTTKRIRP